MARHCRDVSDHELALKRAIKRGSGVPLDGGSNHATFSAPASTGALFFVLSKLQGIAELEPLY